MSGHVDQVHPEIMVMMRNSMKESIDGNPTGSACIDDLTDEEVLEFVNTGYPGGVEGYKADIGAKP